MSTKWQIACVSGAGAIAAKVQSNGRMQQGILIKFCLMLATIIVHN